MLKGKELVIAMIGAVVVVLLMFATIEILKWVSTSNQKITAGEQVYKVVQQDSEGYWYACKAMKAEDGTYVPQSYYDGEDECVVYLKNNVKTKMPRKGDLVTIEMNETNEEPHVFIAHE